MRKADSFDRTRALGVDQGMRAQPSAGKIASMTEITSSKAALIVVDMQVGTIANARSVPAEQLLTAVTYAIDQFRAATRPVIFAISTGTPPGVTQYGSQGRTWPSEDTQLLPEIHTSVDDLTVHRATWSAFTSTPLAEHLTEAEVSEVVIVGIATTFGVESTARSAADLGYNVIVLADAVSDPDQGGHDRTLARVIPALGQVLTTKDYTPKSPE